jgi:hypothetical protein
MKSTFPPFILIGIPEASLSGQNLTGRREFPSWSRKSEPWWTHHCLAACELYFLFFNFLSPLLFPSPTHQLKGLEKAFGVYLQNVPKERQRLGSRMDVALGFGVASDPE